MPETEKARLRDGLFLCGYTPFFLMGVSSNCLTQSEMCTAAQFEENALALSRLENIDGRSALHANQEVAPVDQQMKRIHLRTRRQPQKVNRIKIDVLHGNESQKAANDLVAAQFV
ncbi:MAG: hypothetical protein HKP10_04780 [Kiritimatiellales bacterium]|nr:hypothetical protein [Kiritimatiellales bacterium]